VPQDDARPVVERVGFAELGPGAHAAERSAAGASVSRRCVT
jgi:hypothetical protein